MSGNSEMFEAMAAFRNGMKELSTSSAINKANSAVQQLRSAQISEGERRAALQNTANDLALQLAAIGSDTNQIKTAFEAISPQQFASPEQAQLSGALSANPFVEQTGKRLMEEKRKFDLDKITTAYELKLAQANAKSELGLDKEMRTTISDRQKEFNRLAKEVMTHSDAVNKALAVLDTKNPIGDRAVRSVLGRAMGNVGNPTEAEQEIFEVSPALKDRARKLFSQATSGPIDETTRSQLKELIGTIKGQADASIEKRARTVAEQLAANYKLDPETALNYIYPTRNKAAATPAPGTTQQPAGASPIPASAPYQIDYSQFGKLKK